MGREVPGEGCPGVNLAWKPGMPDAFFGSLRIWERSQITLARGPAPPAPQDSEQPPGVLHLLAEQLAAEEILRGGYRQQPAEPLTLQWYLELEHVRHQRQGRWIPRLLEF